MEKTSVGQLQAETTSLPVSDPEKSVFSKGLSFLPLSKKLDEFSVKQDVEIFLRLVQLEAFFHDKDQDQKDTFETLQTQKSKRIPLEGQLASLYLFRDLSLSTKLSNPSSEERVGLENLSKRRDRNVKAADKGKLA